MVLQPPRFNNIRPATCRTGRGQTSLLAPLNRGDGDTVHMLIDRWSHDDLQSFLHPTWCRISDLNSTMKNTTKSCNSDVSLLQMDIIKEKPKIPLDSWLHGQDGHRNKATGVTNHQGASTCQQECCNSARHSWCGALFSGRRLQTRPQNMIFMCSMVKLPSSFMSHITFKTLEERILGLWESQKKQRAAASTQIQVDTKNTCGQYSECCFLKLAILETPN